MIVNKDFAVKDFFSRLVNVFEYQLVSDFHN